MEKNRNTKNLAWLLVIPLVFGIYYLATNFSNSEKNNPTSAPIEKRSLKKQAQKTNTEDLFVDNENIVKAKKKSIEPAATSQNKSDNESASSPAKSPSTKSNKKASSKPEEKPNKTIQNIPSNIAKVTLAINKGSGSKNYSIEIAPGSSVLDLLSKASSKHGFSLKYRNYSYGAFVEEIDGVRTNESQSMYWIYYINGKLANLGASSQKIKKGDSIAWKYEKAN